MKNDKKILAFASLTSVLIFSAACTTKKFSHFNPNGAVPTKRLKVVLHPKSGSIANGSLTLEQYAEGVFVTGVVVGLSPGEHGFHFHEKGNCSAVDASSAGAHLSLEGEKHGAPGDSDSHLGDLGNITANDKGEANVKVLVWKATIKDAKATNSLVNRSIVVHGSEDDLESQPSGNSGTRVACGVIRK